MSKSCTVSLTPEAKAKLKEMADKSGATQKCVCSLVVTDIWSISAKSEHLTGKYAIVTFTH